MFAPLSSSKSAVSATETVGLLAWSRDKRRRKTDFPRNVRKMVAVLLMLAVVLVV